MSTAKRPRQRQADAIAAPLPPAKRTKFGQDAVQQPSSLAFLTDERKRAGKTIEAKPTNGVNTGRVDRVDESKPAINGVIEIGSDDDDAESESESELSSDDPSDESDVEAEEVTEQPKINGTNHNDEDEEMKDDMEAIEELADRVVGKNNELALTNGHEQDDDQANEDVGLSFGDMLQAAHPEVIDVSAAFNELVPRTAASAGNSRALQAPSATSLGTVLTQALRTNDKDLLESCLQTKDLASIKSTIQRLQSPLVATLMQKLAERLHKRPGRAGPLMVWVQWALVTHGGYLAGQPQVVKKLRSLRQVVRERANSLQSLITLKGKLDMLSAQVELRRSMKAQRAYQDESDDSDVDVVYVEGVDEDEFTSDEEDDAEPASRRSLQTRKNKAITNEDATLASDEEMDGDVPLINGIDDDAEMESMGEEDEDDNDVTAAGLIDDEAEESENEESMSSEEDVSDSASEEDQEADGSSSSDDESVANLPATRSGRPIKRNALIKKR